ALFNVELEIPAGALVGITGPVGSGKSALARAILGLYPLESGTVMVDGRAVGEMTDVERASVIGYLPQDPVLFSGSVAENVALAPGALVDGEGALRRASRLASLDEDVRAFPQAFDTEIGELGVRISGGQRQRIGLARAIAVSAPGRPGLLVLDDPFSAVDVDTEASIVASLRQAFGAQAPPEERITIVMCSHRLTAFPHAAAVVVLKDGRIDEVGTHAQLMVTDGVYARIYRAQRAAEVPVGAAE